MAQKYIESTRLRDLQLRRFCNDIFILSRDIAYCSGYKYLRNYIDIYTPQFEKFSMQNVAQNYIN